MFILFSPDYLFRERTALINLLDYVRHDKRLIFVRAVDGGVAFLVGVPVLVRERLS